MEEWLIRVLMLTNMHGNFNSDVLRCLASAGIEAVVMGSELSRGTGIDAYCAGFYQIDDTLLQSRSELLSKIAEVAVREKIDVIIPICVESISFTADHAERLREICPIAPVADAAVVRMLHDKWELYKLTQAMQVDAPLTMLLESVEQAEQIPYTAPLVTKALNLTGGEGIEYHNSEEQWLSRRSRLSYPQLLQEYVPGSDMCVSCYSINGETIASATQEYTIGGLQFIEYREAVENCKKILKHLNYSGPSHFDFRLTEDRLTAKMLECNPRFWGSVYASKMGGINFPELAVKLAQNIDTGSNLQVDLVWLPFKKKELLENPVLLIKRRASIRAALGDILGDLKKNMAYEIYKMLYSRNKDKAEAWIKLCMRNKRIRIKYRA